MDIKLFLGYIQDKQKNNFEMTSSMNERNTKSFLQPKSLIEARKMKPTATDRENNRKIEIVAIEAHRHAANAITSVPGFKIHPKYPGDNNPEDPEHGSVMANLADRAPGVTDTETAIRLVAPMHNIDPEAAIAALGSSAPMSPQDFMRAMRR